MAWRAGVEHDHQYSCSLIRPPEARSTPRAQGLILHDSQVTVIMNALLGAAGVREVRTVNIVRSETRVHTIGDVPASKCSNNDDPFRAVSIRSRETGYETE